MTNKQKGEIEALRRMQVFLQKNAAALGPVIESPPKAALDEALTGLDTQVANQLSARVNAASRTAEKAVLREDLRLHHMQPITAIARANLAGTTAITALRLPDKKLNDERLAGWGDAMATAASQYTQVFLDHKLPADFIAQLQAAVAALRQATADRTAAVQKANQATKALEDRVVGARSLVTVLNALVVKQLKGQADLLKGWVMTKRIPAKPGVPQGTTAGGTATPPTPAVSGTTAPAATAGSPSTPEVAKAA